ncbi:hypothetical protein TWF730_003195 [Orbilia blumenaviensis]|uniref:RNase III domain-containing protein n=1 Tax=Orbilia blumenaviensis TaxID=1796055 RepID=A0AAV9U8L6_9PEZI
MQRLVISKAAKQALDAFKTSKGGTLAPTLKFSGSKSQNAYFSSAQTQATKEKFQLFTYPPDAKVPVPPEIVSPELRRVLQENTNHLNFDTRFGILSRKRLEHIGDVEIRAVITPYLVKMQPQLQWPEMMYLEGVLNSNAQLGLFAKDMDTAGRIGIQNIQGGKRLADLLEAQIGALLLENENREATKSFIEKLIEPSIPFHREVFRANGHKLL